MAVLTDYRAEQALNPGDILQVNDNEAYTIGKVIGFGGSAIVYEAISQSGRTLAVKEIFPRDRRFRRVDGIVRCDRKGGMEIYAQRLDKEIAMGGKIREYAVRAIGLWTRLTVKTITTRGVTHPAEDGIFALMEDMTKKGVGLEALLLALPDSHGIYFAALILEEVLKALINVHRQNMVFGDISIGNLWFSEPRPAVFDVGVCNLLDFGNSRYLDDCSTDRFSTPGFIPPEMLEGQLPDQRGDIYSAGCLFLYCLNRSISFGDSPIYRQTLFNRYDASLLGGCTERAFQLIQNILKNTMSEDPNDRYPTAEKLLEDIQSLKGMVQPPEFPLPGLPIAGSAFIPHSRDREIEEYCKTLKLGQPVYIWGGPGVGKSETAIQLANTVDRYGACFLSCHAPEKQEQEFVEETILHMPLENYRFSGPPNLSREALRWKEFMDRLQILKKHAAIVILDNFDCPQRSLDMLRSERAYRELMKLQVPVVFTTRYRVEEQPELYPLPESILAQLMRQYCPDPKIADEELLRLMRSVDHNTLVCELIAKTLGKSHRTVTPEQILTKLNIDGPKVYSDKDRDNRTARLYNHIRQLMDVLTLTEAQKRVMVCAALLPDQGMAYPILLQALNCSSDLDGLTQCGWLKCSDDDTVTIHPMVREVCIGELCPNDENCGDFLDRLYDMNVKNGDFQIQLSAADCMARAAKLFSDPQWQVECAYCSGEIYSSLLLYDKAIEMLSVALSLQQKQNDKMLIARTQVLLCSCYVGLKQYSAAQSCAEAALKALKGLPNAQNAKGAVYNNLGHVYLGQRNYRKAIDCIEQSIRFGKQMKNRKMLAGAYSSLASVYSEQEKWNLAVDSMKTSLKYYTDEPDPHHQRNLADTYNNLATLYLNAGKDRELASAEKYLLKALAIYQASNYPDDHVVLLTLYINLSGVYQKLGNYDAALAYAQKALQIDERQKTDKLPITLNAAASAYYLAGDYAHAKQLFLRLLTLHDQAGTPIPLSQTPYLAYLICCEKLGEAPTYHR